MSNLVAERSYSTGKQEKRVLQFVNNTRFLSDEYKCIHPECEYIRNRMLSFEEFCEHLEQHSTTNTSTYEKYMTMSITDTVMTDTESGYFTS